VSTGIEGGSYQWSPNAGPGDVSFGSLTSDGTTVQADAAGEYTVNVTYTDGGVDTDASDTLYICEVTVDEPATQYIVADETLSRQVSRDICPEPCADGKLHSAMLLSPVERMDLAEGPIPPRPKTFLNP